MFGRNIRYYRLRANLSQEALAQKIGCGKMAISNYENDKRDPDEDTLSAICNALGISLSKLLDYVDGFDSVIPGKFRKSDNLSAMQQEAIVLQIEQSVNRYIEVARIIGPDVILPIDDLQIAACSADEAASSIRCMLGFAEGGALGNLTQIVENRGIFVTMIDGDRDFSGYSCRTKKGVAVIAVNSQTPVVRQRFTIAHELVHLTMDGDRAMSEREVDNIAGRFLLPTKDLVRELGAKRKNVGVGELKLLCDEYGVSASCAAYRAYQEEIISRTEYKKLCGCTVIYDIPAEAPLRMTQLVCRAYSEGEIGLGKVAEMLDINALAARNLCGVEVSAEW